MYEQTVITNRSIIIIISSSSLSRVNLCWEKCGLSLDIDIGFANIRKAFPPCWGLNELIHLHKYQSGNHFCAFKALIC